MGKDNKKTQNHDSGPKVTRARIPKGEETIGVVQKRHGGNKMTVSCFDGVERNCRVPGRLKRRLWLRPGAIVLIQPWELDKDRGDIIFKYPSSQIAWLRKNGYLETEQEEF